jgi:uncharacterized protein with von Willebrand factor type A (vWA) domain
MKVKLIEVYSSVATLNKLIEEPLPARVSFKLMKLLNQLNAEVKLVEDQRLKLVKQYSEDGSTVSDTNKDSFIQEFTEFLNDDIDLAWEPIEIDALGENIKLSVTDLSKMQYLFSE